MLHNLSMNGFKKVVFNGIFGNKNCEKCIILSNSLHFALVSMQN